MNGTYSGMRWLAVVARFNAFGWVGEGGVVEGMVKDSEEEVEDWYS